ncbi:MAG TPA: DivIVA domain-containing protein [Gaiellaceae bacterium]|nr:DivIVA domain-containing protein [Gaiellaceae bacterium]
MSSGEAVDRGQNGSQTVTNTIQEADFPVSRRGYDREAVDSYVSRVRDVVAQLEKTSSPDAAVKDALEKVGEQTKSVLESAGQSAEEIRAAATREAEEIVTKAKAESSEIAARSKAEAKETVGKARKEAAEHLQRTQDKVTALQEEAEARLRELHADTANVRQERGGLLDEIHEFAVRVEGVAKAADARFPQHQKGDEPAGDEIPQSEGAEQADAPADPTEAPAS